MYLVQFRTKAAPIALYFLESARMHARQLASSRTIIYYHIYCLVYHTVALRDDVVVLGVQ